MEVKRWKQEGISMNKDFCTEITPETPNSADMEMINLYARKALEPQDVYTFRLLLCDNEVDRDFERFDTAALQTLAELFVGKTGLFNHSMNARDQTSRLFAAEVVTDGGRMTSTGEPYTFIRAKAYMPKTAKNADLIAEIDAGIKKEASIGCSVRRLTCSVCGADRKTENCGHHKGKSCGGQICHTVLSEPADAYEWSFVAVPAQVNAGIMKTYKTKKEMKTMENILKALRETGDEITLGRQEKENLLTHIEGLEKQAAQGKAYREELTMEVIRMGLITLPQIGGESLNGICERLTVGELRELKKAFADSGEKIVPMKPQLKPEPRTEPVNNSEFIV